MIKYNFNPSLITMAQVYAFVSNRGGAGKSSLVSQVAPALALRNPGKQVLLLDLSIQGDASVITLGGTGAPRDLVPGIRTRGAEVIAALPNEKRSLAFVNNAVMAATPPVFMGGWGVLGRAVTPANLGSGRAHLTSGFEWQKHAVRVRDAHPAGNAPENLWISPGGRALYTAFPASEVLTTAASLRTAFTAMGPNVLVVIDTDAELAERTSSLIGISASRSLCMVLTSSWTDYQRLLDDAANGFFAGLTWLAERDPASAAKISLVVFNNVQLLNKNKSGVGGTMLPFTPPRAALDAIGDISNHLYSMGTAPTTNYKQFFSDPAVFGSHHAFVERYVTGFSTVPTTVWQDCQARGVPVVCAAGEGAKGPAAQIEELVARM